jgi:hypothetical protein
MIDAAYYEMLYFILVFVMLLTSYVPVNLKIGGPIDELLSMYFATLMFRGIVTIASCFSGQYEAILMAIVVAVVVEVSILVHMSMTSQQTEVLA